MPGTLPPPPLPSSRPASSLVSARSPAWIGGKRRLKEGEEEGRGGRWGEREEEEEAAFLAILWAGAPTPLSLTPPSCLQWRRDLPAPRTPRRAPSTSQRPPPPPPASRA